MVNKPKAIGTAAETAVVRFMRGAGFPTCERRALTGAQDQGDVTGIPGVVVEVKGGNAAKALLPSLVTEWLRQTETERVNARADIGMLVMQRRGFGPARIGEWWAVFDAADVCPRDIGGHVFMTLAQACVLLRRLGYGDE